MALNSKDLMIGDYVLGKDVSDKPVQVMQINDQNVHYKRGNGYISAGFEYLDPVPLTEDILEKNGFYHERNVGYVYEDSENYEVIFDSFNQELRILYNRDVVLNLQEWEFPVHRLQHALRLCGIDKEIVL